MKSGYFFIILMIGGWKFSEYLGISHYLETMFTSAHTAFIASFPYEKILEHKVLMYKLYVHGFWIAPVVALVNLFFPVQRFFSLVMLGNSIAVLGYLSISMSLTTVEFYTYGISLLIFWVLYHEGFMLLIISFCRNLKEKTEEIENYSGIEEAVTNGIQKARMYQEAGYNSVKF